ncbi:uncharacterized protein BDZ99DRAFT_521649 [Mytilinidion resinicola]|uniref:Uncharacterized protein n=1 Tax=Mytilinidion resinicola TaxID=574789 RepID=A0A6A6YK70_9PEZI|nr:uncharacterized protein BDZ99DRAFT_521649 [Mytilinidion resinicola]KAF2809211.1 hypothetical protein BDZ99DRAFT_521649 [Mytilinidion resinicola]
MPSQTFARRPGVPARHRILSHQDLQHLQHAPVVFPYSLPEKLVCLFGSLVLLLVGEALSTDILPRRFTNDRLRRWGWDYDICGWLRAVGITATVFAAAAFALFVMERSARLTARDELLRFIRDGLEPDWRLKADGVIHAESLLRIMGQLLESH